MTPFVQIITTTPTEQDARRIAAALVEARLAACVQISGPIQSTYRWKGAIESAAEWQCAAKTRRDLVGQIEEAIGRLHPYDVPEILALPILSAGASYAAWLEEQTRPEDG
ncbi:MAG: divalent-cation tolerance protein CutA [Pirellulales bacterium]|nr:divalent-cation tolerance protein CutA [Pirellulales bacterium]